MSQTLGAEISPILPNPFWADVQIDAVLFNNFKVPLAVGGLASSYWQHRHAISCTHASKAYST